MCALVLIDGAHELIPRLHLRATDEESANNSRAIVNQLDQMESNSTQAIVMSLADGKKNGLGTYLR